MFAKTEILTGRWRIALAVGLGAALLILGGWVVAASVRPSAGATAAPVPVGNPLDPPAPPEALVFVSGAVAAPGLYRLPTTARVADAIAAAGGITNAADPSHLPDLAARVHDGKQVNVPFLRSSSSRVAAMRLDLNTATLDELKAVPGMPLGLPEAIVDYRTLWGGFTSVAELRSMLGVDGTTAAAIRPYLTVTPPAP